MVCYTYGRPGVYTVTLKSTDKFCAFPPVIKQIIINDLNNYILPDTLLTCLGNPITIKGNKNINNLIITWLNAKKEVIGRGDSVNIAKAVSGYIFVEIEDINKCKASDSIFIDTSNPFADLDKISPLKVCAGDTSRITLINKRPNQPITIVWASNSHIISGGNTLSPLIGIGRNETGSFVLRYKVTTSLACVLEDSIIVNINPKAIGDFTVRVEDCDNFKVCVKVNDNVTALFKLDFGNTAATNDTSIFRDVCYTYPIAGSYEISLIATGGFCQFEPVKKTVVLSRIGDLVAPNEITVCLRDTAKLSLIASVPNFPVTWSNQAGQVLSTTRNLNYVVTKNDVITIKMTDPNGCVFVDSVKLTALNEFPQLEFISPFEICLGDTITFPMVNRNPNHLVTILWDADKHIIGRRDTLNPKIGVEADVMQPFTLRFTARTQFGCTIRDSVRFILGQPAKVEIDLKVENCLTNRVCFKVVGDYKGFAYWDFGDTTVTTDFSILKEVCYTYPSKGTYTINLRNITNQCSFKPVSRVLTLNDKLTIFTVDTVNACFDANVRLDVPPTVSTLNYEWFTIGGVSLGKTPFINVKADSTKRIVLNVFDINGCPFKDTLTIRPFKFDAKISMPQVFCLDKQVMVEMKVNNVGNINYIYDWNPKECVVAGGNTSKPTIDVTKNKSLTGTVTHPTLGCVYTETIQIVPVRITVSVAATPDTVIDLFKSADIFVSNPGVGWKYLWSNGSTNARQTVTPLETTTYSVTVTDTDGCTGIAQITIRVNPPDCEEDVFVPTAFTPNFDGVNDVLFVRSKYIDEMDLIIYNRWGQEIFTSKDKNIGWDGSFKGATLSPDVYAYYLRVKCVDGTEIKRRGNVSLLK
jgi:gliding motility-associated-like protein